jgi:hypothetical protein
MRDRHLDLDMKLKATLHGKEEIKTGLEYLLATYRTTTVCDTSLSTEMPNNQPLKTYLNLRYANFKAAGRYRWTKAEAKDLKTYRSLHCEDDDRQTSEPDIVDDKDVFPVPS